MLEQKRQRIMLVDDNPASLSMGKNMLKDFYEVYALPSAERMFRFLESVTPDLILLDVAMPGMNGFDVLRILKADACCADIPVIFVTSGRGEREELEGLSPGAADYVAKPFSAAILLKRIENHLLIKKQKADLENLNNTLLETVKERTAQLFSLRSSIVNSVAGLVELRDSFTGGHIDRTQKYVQLLIEHLMKYGIYSDEVLPRDSLGYIVSSTQLHDLGKIFISDTVLNKPGRFTPGEFEIMKTHVAKGVEAIEKMERQGEEQAFLEYAKIVAGAHHEKWDGSGYPSGLKGRDIPLLGRLMAIADAYDALVSARPYKAPLSTGESADIIIKNAGSHFDPVLVEAFRELEGRFSAVAKEPGDHRFAAAAV